MLTDTAFHALLLDIHCQLQDGELSDTCRLMYQARKAYVNGSGTPEDVETMKGQDHFLQGMLGMVKAS